MANSEAQTAQPRYKRKLTDARREQNRRAQKLWRERQKKQRDEALKTKVLEELSRKDDNVHQIIQDDNDWMGTFPGGTDAITAFDLDFPREELDPPQHLLQHGQLDALGKPLPAEHSIISPEHALPDPALPVDVAVYYYFPADPESEDMRYAWPIDEDVSQKVYVKPAPRRSPANTANSSSSHGQGSPYQFAISNTGFLPPGSSIYTPQSSTDQHIPSPYLNHLQLVGESCFAATLSIAQCLGISRPSYVNDHPSPFTTSSNSNIHTIPVDLRPSGYQLILPHPCYLDCIPFPHFRSMAVYLSSMKKLDHCSLFLDLMHDGLVCWGRGRANAGHGRSMKDGVAWSKRSWEARRWFWRKWGFIARMNVEDAENGPPSEKIEDEDLDDEDGMLSGSQWWWAQQDDEEDIEVAGKDAATSGSTGEVVQQSQEEYGSLLSRILTCNVSIRDKADVVWWD